MGGGGVGPRHGEVAGGGGGAGRDIGDAAGEGQPGGPRRWWGWR